MSQQLKHVINITVRVHTEVCEEKWFQYVSDFIKSIYSAVNSRGFKILKATQSNKSYTYYISFQPVSKDGELFDEVLEFQIELRDHPHKGKFEEADSSYLIIRDYYIANKSYDDMLAVLREIWAILDDLQEGDFTSFLAFSELRGK